jgi:hypothetical protein
VVEAPSFKMSMLWTGVMGMVVRSTKPYAELAEPRERRNAAMIN